MAVEDSTNDGPWYAGAIGRIPEDDALVWRDDAAFGPRFYAASPKEAEAAARRLNDLEKIVEAWEEAKRQGRPKLVWDALAKYKLGLERAEPPATNEAARGPNEPPKVTDPEMCAAWLSLADHFDKSDPNGPMPSLLRDAAARLTDARENAIEAAAAVCDDLADGESEAEDPDASTVHTFRTAAGRIRFQLSAFCSLPTRLGRCTRPKGHPAGECADERKAR